MLSTPTHSINERKRYFVNQVVEENISIPVLEHFNPQI